MRRTRGCCVAPSPSWRRCTSRWRAAWCAAHLAAYVAARSLYWLADPPAVLCPRPTRHTHAFATQARPRSATHMLSLPAPRQADGLPAALRWLRRALHLTLVKPRNVKMAAKNIANALPAQYREGADMVGHVRRPAAHRHPLPHPTDAPPHAASPSAHQPLCTHIPPPAHTTFALPRSRSPRRRCSIRSTATTSPTRRCASSPSCSLCWRGSRRTPARPDVRIAVLEAAQTTAGGAMALPAQAAQAKAAPSLGATGCHRPSEA